MKREEAQSDQALTREPGLGRSKRSLMITRQFWRDFRSRDLTIMSTVGRPSEKTPSSRFKRFANMSQAFRRRVDVTNLADTGLWKIMSRIGHFTTCTRSQLMLRHQSSTSRVSTLKWMRRSHFTYQRLRKPQRRSNQWKSQISRILERVLGPSLKDLSTCRTLIRLERGKQARRQ